MEKPNSDSNAIPQSATDINSSEETADIQMTEMVDKEEENILTVFTNILEEEKSRQEVNDQDDREMSKAFKEESIRDDVMTVGEEEEMVEADTRFFEDCPQPKVITRIRNGTTYESNVEILLDSGSDMNLINEKIAKKFRKHWKKVIHEEGERWFVTTANGSKSELEFDTGILFARCLGGR